MKTGSKLTLAGAAMVAGVMGFTASKIAAQTKTIARAFLEDQCTVHRIIKSDETRVVFVIRCPSSGDIGIMDVDMELYKKGGLMMGQIDKE